jgi:cob(I)alamin adenosyltransferase
MLRVAPSRLLSQVPFRLFTLKTNAFPSSKFTQMSSTFGTRSKVYTRTGDKGTSSLYSGERRRKDDPVFEALGDIDELNAAIGLSRQHAHDSGFTKLERQLEIIQSRLMDVSAHIATPRQQDVPEAKINRTEVETLWITTLENWIDDLDKQLTPLVKFILPSGGINATTLHLCRTICRRAERKVVGLALDGTVDERAVKYLNRLSDFIFTAARFSAKEQGFVETLYLKESDLQDSK